MLGMICVSAALEEGEPCESPTHVYLDAPLGGRAVIDGFSGEVVPYKNVLADLQERIDREGWPLDAGEEEPVGSNLEERFLNLIRPRVESRPVEGG